MHFTALSQSCFEFKVTCIHSIFVHDYSVDGDKLKKSVSLL